MDGGAGLALRAVFRGVQMAGSFGLFGTLLLSVTLLRRHHVPGLKRLAWICLAVALGAGLVWFLLQAENFSEAQTLSDYVGSLSTVAWDTRFGTVLIGRCAALAVAALCYQAGRVRLAALLAGGAVVAEAWLTHGGSMEGRVGMLLLPTSMLHILAAASWLGTLPALYLGIRRLPEPDIGALAQKYSPLGIACVAALLVTGLIEYLVLIDRLGALVSTAYGVTALVKIGGFTLLVVLAAMNRNWLTPRLPATRRQMLRSIGVEVLVGMVVLIAAGFILQFIPPAMVGMQMGS
jgi:putative copper resistance protein D